jgi:hypothetical protein
MEQQNRGAHSSDQVTHIHDPDDDIDASDEGQDELLATAATVGVVGAGVLIFEAALLPGMVLGVVTMMVPKYLPRIGSALNPLIKSTVRGAYKMGQKTKEMFAEAQEQVHDIVAEVDAETDKKVILPKTAARAKGTSAI